MPRLALLCLLSLLSFPGVLYAQGGDVAWKVDYFDNGYLIGEPAHTEEIRGAITKDWSSGSPDSDISNDFFSARFGTRAYFSAGTWRFSALADDGVAVYVDQQPVINTFEAGSPSVNIIGEITLTQGFHTVQVDYREAEGLAFIYMSWAPAGNNPQPDPFPEPSGPQLTSGRWTAEYYNNTTLSAPRVFANDTPSPVAYWGTNAPVDEVNPDAWSARFSTRQFFLTGRYRLTVRADDGVRFFFDGQLLVDQFGPAQDRAFVVEFDIVEGHHDLVIEHVEYGGEASLNYALIRISPGLEPDNGTVPQPQPVADPFGSGTITEPSQAVIAPTPVPATGVTATITARFVNIRAEPRVARDNIVSTASQGQQFPVVGRANNGWVQVEANGTRGWINGRYINSPGIIALPITAEGPTR
jgi:hypothetical protein